MTAETEANIEPASPPPPPPWQSRPVMWGTWGGIRHVVTNAVVMGDNVVQRFACGGSTLFWGLRIATWHEARRTFPRICRRCRAMLENAGASGSLE